MRPLAQDACCKIARMSKAMSALLALAILCWPLPALSQATGRTSLDSIYSDAQSLRGQAAYNAHCATCHGAALEGVSAPELSGNRFLERWREGTLDGIYNFIRQRMPLGRSVHPGADLPQGAAKFT